METFLARLAVGVARRRWFVIAAWLALLVGGAWFSIHQADRLSGGGWDVPGSQSTRAAAVLPRFPTFRPTPLNILVTGRSPDAVTSRLAVVRSKIPRLARLRPGPVKLYEHGRTAIMPLIAPTAEPRGPEVSAVTDLRKRLVQTNSQTATRVIGERAVLSNFLEVSKKELAKGEALGFPLTLLILLAAFGTVLAALMPLSLGFSVVFLTGALIYLLSGILEMSIYVSNMASMIGIGVSVDYSLFIVSRFRSGLHSRRLLADGDQVALGAATFRVELPAEAAAPAQATIVARALTPDATPSLVIASGPLAGHRFRVEGELAVGRETSDITLDDPEVSRRHAVVRRVDGGLEIADLGSGNGTFVNGRRITEPQPLAEGDAVTLGQTTLTAEVPPAGPRVFASSAAPAAPPSLVSAAGPSAGQRFPIERELLLGREAADVTIDDPEVSRRHAFVRPVDGGVEIADIGSSNGTFVNGERLETIEETAALARALATSGTAVVFSGATVLVSLAGLFLINVNAVRSMAIGAIIAVSVAVLASITLLPAVLAVVGRRIERFAFRLPRIRPPRPEAESFWWRWTRRVMARPIVALILASSVMLALTAPVLKIEPLSRRLLQLPPNAEVRAATEHVQKIAGAGFGGPALLVVSDKSTADAIRSRVLRLRGVSGAGPVLPSADRRLFLTAVVLSSDPESAAATRTYDAINAEARLIAEPRAASVVEGGATSFGLAIRDAVFGGLWKVLLFLLAVSYIVLFLLLRSVLLPLKAILMNLLSVGAAYGVLVVVFQWGWFDWTGFHSPGYIDMFVPALVLAVTFGLSMDYEVFLLAQIRERYRVHGSTEVAVAEGLVASARTITSAALIMVAVFGAFAIAGSTPLRQLGVGLAVAVLLDATLVRLVIVPATMRLMDAWNWWLPRRLDRILPTVTSPAH